LKKFKINDKIVISFGVKMLLNFFNLETNSPEENKKLMENKIDKELEKVIENKFLTPSKFALEIENIVICQKCNYIDAIVLFCEENNLEVDSVTKLVSKPLKERLKWDAIRLNFMKKTSRAKLPL
jgi:hypothetical protein